MIPLPYKVDPETTEGRGIVTLWPYMGDGSRRSAAFDITAGELDSALAACIQGCYLNGYRIPEDYLQELEEYADDWPDEDAIHRMLKDYIARVRSLDEHPAPTQA